MSIPMQIQQLLHDKQFSLALMLAVSHQIVSELFILTSLDSLIGMECLQRIPAESSVAINTIAFHIVL